MNQRRVLLIDDDYLFGDLVEQILADDFIVQKASNSWLGMDMVDDFKPDAIILDILMPAANGLSFLNEIVSYSDTAHIPIIVCSSIASQLNLRALRAAGVEYVIDKTQMRPKDIKLYLKHILEQDYASKV